MTDQEFDIEIQQMILYPKWILNIPSGDTNCGICKNLLLKPCTSCINNKKNIEFKCHVALGECGHAFHKDCIESWLNKDGKKCPICICVWNYKNNNMYNDYKWKKIMNDLKKKSTS